MFRSNCVEIPTIGRRIKTEESLPYLDSVRFDILGNKDIEILRFNRGELDLIEGLEADTYERLQSKAGGSAVNAGATTDVEMVWFNQVERSPIKAAKKKWFQSKEFVRQSQQPSTARIWFAWSTKDMPSLPQGQFLFPASGSNTGLRPTRHDPAEAKRKLVLCRLFLLRFAALRLAG